MTKLQTKTEKTTKIHPIVQVTPVQLVGELMKMDGTGTSFEGMDCKVLVKMRKTGNRWHNRVYKFYSVNTVSNANYTNSVNRQREREGLEADFMALPRTWGERIGKSPVIQHKGQFYFSVHINTVTTDVTYQDVDGNDVAKEDFAEFLPKPSASRQGVENEVITRDYKIESILQIRMKGYTYIVKHG